MLFVMFSLFLPPFHVIATYVRGVTTKPFPASIYMFKVINGNARIMRETCSKLKIKTLQRYLCMSSGYAYEFFYQLLNCPKCSFVSLTVRFHGLADCFNGIRTKNFSVLRFTRYLTVILLKFHSFVQ